MILYYSDIIMIKNRWRRISSSLDQQWIPIGFIHSSLLAHRIGLMIAHYQRYDLLLMRMHRPAFSVAIIWERERIIKCMDWYSPQLEKDGIAHQAWSRNRISRNSNYDLACLSFDALIAHSDEQSPLAFRAAASSSYRCFTPVASVGRIPAGFLLRSGHNLRYTFVQHYWWDEHWDQYWVNTDRMKFSYIPVWRDELWVNV